MNYFFWKGVWFFFKELKVFLLTCFEALSWLDVYMVGPYRYLIEYIKGVGKSSSPLLEIFM